MGYRDTGADDPLGKVEEAAGAEEALVWESGALDAGPLCLPLVG